MRRLPESPARRRALRAFVFAIAVGLERRRIARPSRRARARHVDLRTGAPPTLWQTIVLLAARDAISWLVTVALPGPPPRPPPDPELTRAMRLAYEQHAGDPAALDAAMTDIYRERHVRPARTVLVPVLIRGIAIGMLNRRPLPFLAQPRTVPDLLAGTRLQRRRRRR